MRLLLVPARSGNHGSLAGVETGQDEEERLLVCFQGSEEPMKPVIRSLTLNGFRSFESERVEFDNPTFLVGRNAAGKSNLVDALAFLQEAVRQPLDEVIRRRGGISSIVHRAEPRDKQ